MMNIIWENPPTHGSGTPGRRGYWTPDVLAALADNPGRWARIAHMSTSAANTGRRKYGLDVRQDTSQTADAGSTRYLTWARFPDNPHHAPLPRDAMPQPGAYPAGGDL